VQLRLNNNIAPFSNGWHMFLLIVDSPVCLSVCHFVSTSCHILIYVTVDYSSKCASVQANGDAKHIKHVKTVDNAIIS